MMFSRVSHDKKRLNSIFGTGEQCAAFSKLLRAICFNKSRCLLFVFLVGLSFRGHCDVVIPDGPGFIFEPPDPEPTEIQLEKGTSLLAKLIDVVNRVPLMDASQVMFDFGFFDIFYKSESTNPVVITVYARNSSERLKSLGLSDFYVEPWRRRESTFYENVAALVGQLDRKEACITARQVNSVVGQPSAINAGGVLWSGLRPKPVTEITMATYELKGVPVGGIRGSLNVWFRNQNCAYVFHVFYTLNK